MLGNVQYGGKNLPDPSSRHDEHTATDDPEAVPAGMGIPGPGHLSVAPTPATPPPSCVSSRASPVFGSSVRKDLQNTENLVHIKVLNIDSRSPEFLDRYHCTNRFVDVDFNTLDINFNLHTWVLVLDFFGKH